jgi:hypothetical protein
MVLASSLFQLVGLQSCESLDRSRKIEASTGSEFDDVSPLKRTAGSGVPEFADPSVSLDQAREHGNKLAR